MPFDEPILLAPMLQPRIWGGDKLLRYFANLDEKGAGAPTEPVGEAWLASDRDGAESRVMAGRHSGMTFAERIALDPTGFYGAAPTPARFPLLVKWVYAREVLSVQVHPSFEDARRLGGADEGKMEAWVVIDAEPGVRLVRGFRPGTTRGEIEAAIRAGTLERYLKWIDVEKGDAVFVAPGVVHAIGAGLLILEVQNNSDTTYRFYDWNRVDANGKARTLHFAKGLAVMREGDASTPKAVPTSISTPWPGERLVRCEAFTLDRFRLCGTLSGTANAVPRVIAVLSGAATISSRHGNFMLRAGSTVIIPARLDAFTLSGDAVFCVVTPPSPETE
ncbi:MAG: class I mannose-6-phosphate isomerase [Deltaproteobacteria bacterium]|nr:class I mannose-6-phosphate isomerase [Deltaproteobacteria bacterium]